jgi:Uncharacterized conserved protein
MSLPSWHIRIDTLRSSVSPIEHKLVRARWGMPSPPKALNGKAYDYGVTNIRNTASPHWRRWLGKESRCLIPVTSFAEPNPAAEV